MAMKEIKIENVTIYVIEEWNPYHNAYWSLSPVDFETAKKLCRQGKAFKASSWDFWGDTVFKFNYVDEEHYKNIVEFLINGGVGEKRSKKIARELIANHRYYEDLEGVVID